MKNRLIWLFLLCAVCAMAQSPWDKASTGLVAWVTGPLVRAASLILIVIAGLMWASGSHHGKEGLVTLIGGVGLAVGAVNVYNWLF
jgi:type IV secretory pathway VirB2 component (pilin)